ncbi:hypothetical protein MtrunA17_Chr1g0207541 [Medicago truncatula]|uniref:Transporter-like protein, putative n=1 Tax=Medicago truncatula TaxID=3880 RepID=A0A072VPU0_MEDTR|nr:uncharacterized protein LOC25485357 isoform X2 [Medicago truncatula]KEH44034.1 transporter-like protein, putative [Medicago truncatula]RHN82214.1 hypothetical protein MtrunA17_Chr1g0207541 [Medicago truncatula]
MDEFACNSPSTNHSPDSDSPPLPRSPTSSVRSKIGKNKLAKELGQSTSSGLKKISSQIRKPPRRKTSPINWFPRKKVDSFLERKIKMLQEVDGVNLTLDQTLGNSNPHYSRVLREKMAAREAAHKAMEARRAALVEASWCRILRAARIPSDEAEAQLLKAEKSATEAFEAAEAMGVIMFDLPDCPKKHCQIETPSINGEGSSTHTFTASFETAFDVDKEVAAAVKTAFTKLATRPSFSKDEFKELLKKISEHPDTDENHQDLTELSSENESESELDPVSQTSELKSEDLASKISFPGIIERKSRKRQSLENRIKLVDMMIERLKCLQEDELSSLATIVATYGLNAALAEVQNTKQLNPAINFPSRRMSSLGLRKSALDGTSRKEGEFELPSLDKFLVKHMTRLEREVCEAKKNHTNETKLGKGSSCKSVDGTPSECIPDLGSILVKKNYSKLEKEINEAKIKSAKEMLGASSGMPRGQKDHTEVPGLDKVLVKHVSRLEKEVNEARKRTANENKSLKSTFSSGEALDTKENINLNMIEENKDGLEKILVKPVHRLEREKLQVLSQGSRVENYRQRKSHGATNVADCESLDKVLVKRVSRLEKEKINIGDEWGEVKKSFRNDRLQTNEEGGGLDQVLVKHKPRLEREKMAAAAQQQDNPISFSVARRKARERELEEAWGGLSLGNSMKPSVSKLEQDKAAWIKAEAEERMQATEAI